MAHSNLMRDRKSERNSADQIDDNLPDSWSPQLAIFGVVPLFGELSKAIRYIKGFDEFVTSSAVPITTDWSDSSPGGNYTR